MEKIWNADQSEFYRRQGCKLLKIKKGYSRRLGRVGVYHLWLCDETFEKAKTKWNEKKRQ